MIIVGYYYLASNKDSQDLEFNLDNFLLQSFKLAHNGPAVWLVGVRVAVAWFLQSP